MIPSIGLDIIRIMKAANEKLAVFLYEYLISK